MSVRGDSGVAGDSLVPRLFFAGHETKLVKGSLASQPYFFLSPEIKKNTAGSRD